MSSSGGLGGHASADKFQESRLKWVFWGAVYMIPFSLDEMRGGIILMYWDKSRIMIQQNITIFLGVDYTILENQRMLKQQQ